MSSSIYDAIKNPIDALIVSIPDYDVLKAPIQAAKDKNIPIIAVYSGLQAAKDLGILAVMSDDYMSGKLIGEELLKDGVKDFVCIDGPSRIPTLLDRCNGVLQAFLDADAKVSANLTDHVIYVEKSRNSTTSTNAQSVAEVVLKQNAVTGIVFLTAPMYSGLSPSLMLALNNTRSYKVAAFDFNKDMAQAFERGVLHYSISSLLYLQTLIPILLLYVQLNLGEKIAQDQILTGPKLCHHWQFTYQ
ncbi:periplasmic binding protein-like I [Gamsiella multidivaricata]|uniref:periplasmic binding protein-like I n=1 Tax=Gamsiella multidivaricata TaxID=101098 RepID=UPI0022202D57|nr:periplasmic binding protein-like I [Gamsiella multidivaricata]KAI7818245.1 periplasmic binding protein-like I [Gamsiella multidivaricata]